LNGDRLNRLVRDDVPQEQLAAEIAERVESRERREEKSGETKAKSGDGRE
jgi:hypothetical protein